MEDQVKIESQPRATGQSTRQANEAIEWLFNNPECWLWIVDHSGSAQASQYLTDLILKRLKNEHHLYEELNESVAFSRPYIVVVDRHHDNAYIKLNRLPHKGDGSKTTQKNKSAFISTDSVSSQESEVKEPTQTDSAIKFVQDHLSKIQARLVQREAVTPVENQIKILREFITVSAQLIELKRLASNQPYSDPSRQTN